MGRFHMVSQIIIGPDECPCEMGMVNIGRAPILFIWGCLPFASRAIEGWNIRGVLQLTADTIICERGSWECFCVLCETINNHQQPLAMASLKLYALNRLNIGWFDVVFIGRTIRYL